MSTADGSHAAAGLEVDGGTDVAVHESKGRQQPQSPPTRPHLGCSCKSSQHQASPPGTSACDRGITVTALGVPNKCGKVCAG